MADWVGRTLSKVFIEQKLGRGGMAEVYLGRHQTLNRPVAVKILHAHLMEEPELQRRFMAEAQAVASLRHPNIVQIYDYDVVEGRPYMVMELLDGLSLATYLRGLHGSGITLPLGTISKLIQDVASALDYAHGREIIHRDIKPANIMLRQGSRKIDPTVPLLPEVEAILTDFGIARLNTATTRTETGTVLGTPAYMSPEQIRGVEIDGRSDIYSLGVVMYEMLAGKPPFDVDTTPAAILVKHLQEEPPPLPQVAPRIQQVVDRALAKDPDNRYQRAGQLSDSLATAVGARPDTGESPPVTRRPADQPAAKPRSRRTFLWVAGGLAGLLGLATCAVLAAVLLLGDLIKPTEVAGPQPATEVALASVTSAPQVDVTATSAPEPQVAPFEDGSVVIQGSRLSARLQGVRAPREGEQYFVWLINLEGEAVGVGAAVFDGANLQFEFTQPPDRGGLLDSTRAILFTLQPVGDGNPDTPQGRLYQADIDPRVPELLELLAEVVGPGPLAARIQAGAGSQVEHFTSHRDLMLSSIDSGSLPGGKLHAEHVINILDGRSGDEFADWNGDGRVENPGDDFGLIPYLELAQAALASMDQAEELDQTTRDQADDLAERAETLIETAARARSLATRIASSDTISEVRPLADELSGFQLREGVSAFAAGLGPIDLRFFISVEPLTAD